ncbi:MAG: DNA methyltransferase [Thermoplasmataceae archaeon]|jgi:DNA modification methylase
MNSASSFKVVETESTYPEVQILEGISIINDAFPDEEFFLSFAGNKVKAYVNLLDLQRLREQVSKVENKLNLEPDNPFRKILENIESIRSYGIRSGKRSFVDYNKERKVRDRRQKVKERGMYFYAVDNNFSKDNKDIPKDLLDKIVVGDSELLLKQLPDNSIDLIFTSPPYNFGLDYSEHKDGINWKQYFGKLFRIFTECIRITKYGGRIAINVQPLYSDFIPIHHIISNFFMEKKMIWRNEIIWEKNNYNAKYTAWGSWKSPSNPYLKYTWEYIEVFSKGDLKHPGEPSNTDILDSEFKEWVNAKWSIAPEKSMKDYGHPAMFPEKLAERVIKLFSFKNDVILDPFNGSGTTTKVARNLNRHYIGIDLSKNYVNLALERLKE